MAVDVLAAAGDVNNTLRHSFYHELESIFWLICWVSIHWQGPGLPRRCALDDPDDKDHGILLKKEGIWKAEDMAGASQRKRAVLTNERDFSETEDIFAPYFCRLKPTARALRTLVAQPLADAPSMSAGFLKVLSLAEIDLSKVAAKKEEINLRKDTLEQHTKLQAILAERRLAEEAFNQAVKDERQAERRSRNRERAANYPMDSMSNDIDSNLDFLCL